jgi:hypothetical protein
MAGTSPAMTTMEIAQGAKACIIAADTTWPSRPEDQGETP